ncbi:MAG TPA: PAS domain S-box protein [Gemmatimonadaceae bacterium]|nr:PAS domain S-box protein [Gemmatimonadaceae bacterium]
MTIDYQALFAHAADGMYVLDASLVIVEANAAFAAFVGVPRESLIGRAVTDVIERGDLRVHPPQTAAVVRDGSAITMRVFQRPDGTVIHAEVAASLLDEGRILCVVRDVGRRAAVSALRDSEARFRGVAENLNAGLVVTDLDNRAVYVNERMCEMTGYRREELEGRQLAPILFRSAERIADAMRLQRRLLGVREQYEVAHRRRDGTTFLAAVSASPLHDGEGRVVGTVGVVIDVTERDEWEREMAAREQRYRLLFEVTPMPAWVYDVESYAFLAVNPAAVAHYGYTEEQFLSMTILDVRPPEDIERVKAQVQARRAGFEGQGVGWGLRHRKADGTLMDVDIISHAFDFEGHSARIVLVNDVTEQARLRRREREMEQQLLHAQKMEAVGRLAGGVAHDFNNLLTVVAGAAEALGDALPGESELRADVQDIRHAVERGAALTRQLLALGRKEVHAPRLLDVHEVVVNVERLLSRALGRGTRMEIHRGAGDLRVMADASQLEQVLVNLAINARDAMPGGGRLVITTGVRVLGQAAAGALELCEGEYVTIDVSDTGIGMDETTRSRAFEPFYTTKGPLEGTGLGLSTVYGIVRQSGGAVTLVSAPGEGTRVTVLLPARGASAPNAHAPLGAARDTLAAPERSSACVLLVEDEPQVRAQARRLLERCGFRVLEAIDGADGLRQFEERRADIDAVVSDVVMPVLGGVEMVARMRALAPEVPVVFVSGFTAEDRDLPLDARTVFVPKPYTLVSLRLAIEAVVAS